MGVLTGVCEARGVDFSSAILRIDAGLWTVAGRFIGVLSGVRKREAGFAVVACFS